MVESRSWEDASDLFPFPGVVAASGQRVTATKALEVSAVFSCVRLLSEKIATLPAATFSGRGGVLKVVKSPAWLDFPTADPGGMGRIDLLSQVVISLLLEGNAYLAIIWDGPNIAGLEVLDPSRIDTHTVMVDGRRRKLFYASDVDADGNNVALGWYTTREILHIPGMMLPGEFKGVSPITFAAESIGLTLAAQKYGATFFRNGATPGAVIEVPGPMSEEGLARARDAWRIANSGVEQAHRVALLTEGAKFSKIAMSPDEAQFLQTRQFQIPEIARIFGVPPHLIGDATGSTSWGSGLAEQGQAFGEFSLEPWTERIAAGFTRLLYAETADRQKSVRFSLDKLRRGGLRERMDSYSIGLQQGIYTIDEVRAWEDLEPLRDGLGAVHRVPLNLAPVGVVDERPAIEPAPAAAAPDDGDGEQEGGTDDQGETEPDQPDGDPQ
ncbi:phage portal protein [Streptomyces sp. NPDC001404]|uniref:phage portal protein n=1 Tax=Streptomyces sp. NPDC001404 TaxID=3364571 RepID=UPI003685AA2A